MSRFDIIVIGAGIAGVSVAAHLAWKKKVLILEMEDRPAYHTTGRSAATYEPNYGPPPMLAFTRASKAFFDQPPKGFAESPLITPRNSLFLEAEGQSMATERLLANGDSLDEISESETRALYPILRDGYAKRSFLDRFTADMDVDLIHRGYLRQFKELGGQLVVAAAADEFTRSDGQWEVTTSAGVFAAPVIVNAAGAWGDVVATRAGAKPMHLTPKRRSIGIVPLSIETDFSAWPMVTDVGETWYAKPQSGKLMVSSADATPVEPHDAYADDLAVAEGIERLMTATTLVIDRLEHSWGGLRTFAPDGCPVIGYDPHTEGFFWLVGQGGYGIQSCPALSESAAAILLNDKLPAAVLDHGLNLDDIAPERFSRT